MQTLYDMIIYLLSFRILEIRKIGARFFKRRINNCVSSSDLPLVIFLGIIHVTN